MWMIAEWLPTQNRAVLQRIHAIVRTVSGRQYRVRDCRDGLVILEWQLVGR